MRHLISILLISLFLSASAWADTIIFSGGVREEVDNTYQAGDKIMYLKGGRNYTVPASLVERVIKSPKRGRFARKKPPRGGKCRYQNYEIMLRDGRTIHSSHYRRNKKAVQYKRRGETVEVAPGRVKRVKGIKPGGEAVLIFENHD